MTKVEVQAICLAFAQKVWREVNREFCALPPEIRDRVDLNQPTWLRLDAQIEAAVGCGYWGQTEKLCLEYRQRAKRYFATLEAQHERAAPASTLAGSQLP